MGFVICRFLVSFLNLVYPPKDIYCFAIFNTALTVHILETNQQNTKIVTHSKKKIAVIAVAILIIALAAALTSGLLLTSQNPSRAIKTSNQSTSQSWIAIGAYATYAGQETVLSMTVSFNADNGNRRSQRNLHSSFN